jgi:hypothetical protein
MGSPSASIVCDGCGRPASPDHISQRVARLELATRFRPVHMNVLFVGLAPMTRLEDDFYGPPQSRDYFDSLMEALEISPQPGAVSSEMNPAKVDGAKLIDFQRRGFYMSFLSECPIPDSIANITEAVLSLAPALIRRIRFNYKPKHIVLLGKGLESIAGILTNSDLGVFLSQQAGKPLLLPIPSDLSARTVFRAGLRTVVSSDAPA